MPGGFSTQQEPEADRETLQLAAVPCLVLLGEAGMGKTTELGALHNDAHSASTLLCRLGAYRSGAAILDYLEREETWRAWRSDRAPLHLFIDGLDECQLALPETVDLLINTLAAGDRRQLVLRIACRTGAWSQRLEETLRSWYGDDFDLVELLPLTSDDAAAVAHRILQGRVDREQLREQLGQPTIEPLAARPVTLRMLAQLLHEGQGRLPDRRVDLYQRGLYMLLREWDDDRDRRAHVDPDDPLTVARWLAAAIVLGNYTGVAERRPEPDGSIPLDELAGPVSLAHLRTVIFTNVFVWLPTADASGWLRTFAHRSFAEFLTAQWLHARGLPPTKLLPLLGNRERVAPQMEEVASWLAALDRSWFMHILARQPEVILRGDPAVLTYADRRDALIAILTACAAGHLPDDATGWEKLLWRLDFPGIENILAEWILAEDHSGPTLFVARRVAIDTAQTLLAAPRAQADVTRLLNVLATVAVREDSKTGESNVRTAAGWALKQLAGTVDTIGGLPRALLEPAVLRLRPLLDLPRKSDPTRELRGLALLTLHPRWLTDEEFVANLKYLPGLDYLGAYESLFTHHIPTWIDGNPPRAARMARRLADLLPRSRNSEPTTLLDSLLRTLTDTCAEAWPATDPVEALVTLWLACPLNFIPPRLSSVHFADPERRRGIFRTLVQVWAERRWRLLSEWLRDLANTPFIAKFRESAQFTRLESLARHLAASPEDPVTQVRSECRLWDSDELDQIFASARYDNHSFGSPETTPAGHLSAGLSNREDSLYWLREAAQETDPMVRDEYQQIAWRWLDIDDDQAIATVRAIVASATGPARPSLEQQFSRLLDDANLRALREKRREHLPVPQGPADGKTPEVRIAELITEGPKNPSNVFPKLLGALTLRPIDTHWGDRYLRDLANFPGWVAASPSTRQQIWSIARAFLDEKKIEDETWFGKQDFPSTLLDACRAFQLLALDSEALPNLGLRPDVWQKWSLALLDKLDMLSPQRLTDDLHRRLREQDPDIATRVHELVGLARRQGSESDVDRAIATALRVRTPAVERMLVEQVRAADLPTWADRNILTTLVKEAHPEFHAVALARLADQPQLGRVHRGNAILALIQRGLRPAEWPNVWRALRSDDDLLLDVFAAQGMSFADRSQAFREVAASDIGELLDHLLTTFPMDADDDRPSRRGVMPVTPRMQAGRARDDLLRFLARRAYPEDADELQRIVDNHGLQSIRWLVHEARTAHDRRTWHPRSPVELMGLTDSDSAKFPSPANEQPVASEPSSVPPAVTGPHAAAESRSNPLATMNILHLALPDLRQKIDAIHATFASGAPAVRDLPETGADIDILRNELLSLHRTLIIFHVDNTTSELSYVANRALAGVLDRVYTGADPTSANCTVLVVRHGEARHGGADLLGFPTVRYDEHDDPDELRAITDGLLADMRAERTSDPVPAPDADLVSIALDELENIFGGTYLLDETFIETALFDQIVSHLKKKPAILVLGPMTSGKTIAIRKATARWFGAPIQSIDALSQQKKVEALLEAEHMPEGCVIIEDIHRVPTLIRRILSWAKNLIEYGDEKKHQRLILAGVRTALEFHLKQAPDIHQRLRPLLAEPVPTQSLITGILHSGSKAARIRLVHAGGLGAAARRWPVLTHRLALEAIRTQWERRPRGRNVITTSPRAAFRRVQENYLDTATEIVGSFIDIGGDRLSVRRLAFLMLWWAATYDTTRISLSALPARYDDLKQEWRTLCDLATKRAQAGEVAWTTSLGWTHDTLVVENILLSATLPRLRWSDIGQSHALSVSLIASEAPRFDDSLGAPTLVSPPPPPPSTPIPPPPWDPSLHPDIAILIALPEEFRSLAAEYSQHWYVRRHPNHPGSDFLFLGPGGYRCTATIMPRMGPTVASEVSMRMLALHPAAIINIGIAGSFKSDDLRIGDVIVPRQVAAYDETGKIEGVRWQSRGSDYRPSASLVADVRELEFTAPTEYAQWRADGYKDLTALRNGPDAPRIAELVTARLLRDQPNVSSNHLASGSFVVASKPFAEFLRESNADIHAGEMEAAGMMAAAEYWRTQPQTLVVRGISDHVDADKKAVDAIGEGSLRRLAMANAWRLVRTLMGLGLLPRATTPY